MVEKLFNDRFDCGYIQWLYNRREVQDKNKQLDCHADYIKSRQRALPIKNANKSLCGTVQVPWKVPGNG